MPDLSLDPSALTVVAPPPPTPIGVRANGISSQSAQKAAKPASTAPRVDLEPLYTNLKAAIGGFWAEYKESMGLFVVGQLNQEEFCLRTDHFLASDPAVEHLHNLLIVGIFTNVGRDPPELGVAPFVSANDKPVALPKPLSGDAAEQRLKTEVMQLPARDRRRLKDVAEPDVSDPIPAALLEYQAAKSFRTPSDAAGSAGGKTNWDLEIRKRYAQPLASETGEFPDADIIQARMTPICYEGSLAHGASSACASFMACAVEQIAKELLSVYYARARPNIPGGSVNSILTHRFKRQLAIEEDRLGRGQLGRVTGTSLLPVEAKEAVGRLSLGMHDLKLATGVGDSGIGQFPGALTRIGESYDDGEYEALLEQRKKEAEEVRKRVFSRKPEVDGEGDVKMNGVSVNGTAHGEDDDDDWGWDGGSAGDRRRLNTALDECLAIGV